MPYVERRVPVITDERIDPEFGTGALKVTPGHDPVDFAIGRDHGLPEPVVIGPNGRMNEEAGDLAGLSQEEAGARILAWSEERGLVEKREPYRHAVGTCERCHSRIEPIISLQWWCAMGELAAPAIAALRDAPRAIPPGVPAPLRDRLARGGAGLVHLPPALVGPPAADLDLPRRAHDRAGGRAVGVRRVRLDGARARPGRARYVVLVGALAVRDPRLAGADARARALLPGRRQLDRARDHPPLGEQDDLLGARAHGRGPVHRRDHPLDRARDRRAADVQEPRHRDRPDGADRGVRRGCDALRAAQDLLDPGRPLLVRRDRGGAKAREQALERRAPDPPERRRGDAGRTSARSRGALDPRPDRRRAGGGGGELARLRLRRLDHRALPPHLRRLLRLVRGGDQAAPVRARRRCARDRARCARAPARAPAPRHAARDRGDLVAAPGPRRSPHRLPVARAGHALCRRRRCARARAGGGADLPAERRPGRARFRR